ncbi:hypothetical protein F0U61_37800 [Archangium violaceum]|uniref:hypothetical protein n=1 Tax=Archangium violaceum TaxID=83451 RepID=UPI002B2CC4E7|nr:hypothetical protein F0U61_37800 [Archangium violaceum]
MHFRRVYQAGTWDVAGRYMGGTEIMHLVPHGGRLYAATSTLQQVQEPGDPAVGAQVLVLESAESSWRVERDFEPRHWRLTLDSLTFTEDGRGRRLPEPHSLLLAAPTERTGRLAVEVREESGSWTRVPLAEGQGTASIRSFCLYRDKVTGLERLFAGTAPMGIFSGVLDLDVPGSIRWDTRPELEGYRKRPMGFAECNGVLHAIIHPGIYRRVDGERPRWEQVYTFPEQVIPISSGLRGLTAIPHPSGQGEVLLAVLEGDRARLLRIDPSASYRDTLELDVLDFLGERWRRRPSYAIAAYDDMTELRHPETGAPVLLMGVGATFEADLSTHPKQGWDPGGWYLIRHGEGRYALRSITAQEPVPMPPLVATRSIALSPFDGRTVFLGGYDPNMSPCRNTAWIFSASLETVLATPS